MSGKLLFLVTEDWYFCSHRLPPARAARAAGFEVVVATRVNRHRAAIEAEGFRIVPLEMRRKSMNPLRELAAIAELVRIYRRERPTVVHQVGMKPMVYGSLAARIARVPGVVNALPGLGFVFTSKTVFARALRVFLTPALRVLLNTGRSVLILQNPDDCAVHVDAGTIVPDRVRLIRGSGVDIRSFTPGAEPAGNPIVMMASRMVWGKGVGEFVEAARLLRSRGASARFVLVGDSDHDNPAAIPVSKLEAWHDEGTVEWWGHRDDMPHVLAQASIVCLPSANGEGIPKVLLEAASCGRPLVATDAPGCREIVRHGDNGLLVPLHDAEALGAAIGRLLHAPDLRRQMGERGRRLVEAEFSDTRVAEQTLAVYRELVEPCPA
jgi:glycosyltransferase involved in cell wall biosynthesis